MAGQKASGSENRQSGKKRILAVASNGGHWVQLLRLVPAFQDHQVYYVATDPSCRSEIGPAPFFAVQDASRKSRLKLLRLAFQIAWIFLKCRPHLVISTGAAPGFFAIRLGRLLRARTVWVDSIANAEELSLSGRRAGPHADLWLTQWPHLARPEGPRFCGAVLEHASPSGPAAKSRERPKSLHLSAQTSEQ